MFIAKIWKAQGAKRIHVVDRDGAFSGTTRNLALVADIAKSAGVPVQTGGGIRKMASIQEVLSKGIDKVVLGTTAIYDTEFIKNAKKKFRNKIIIYYRYFPVFRIKFSQ